MGQLPEGRKALTDDDMVILLHNMARNLERLGDASANLRQVADRLAELSKTEQVSKYKDMLR